MSNCNELVGSNSSIKFKFGKVKSYLGNTHGTVKLQIECFSNENDCFVDVNLNGTNMFELAQIKSK